MHIKAKKSLGQNFLINPHILDKIVSAAEITKNDTILEVGPGTGNLTKRIAQQAGRVIAVEKDHRLIESLKDLLKDYPDTKILEGDILKSDPSTFNLRPNGYKIVANIPYYITSYLFRMVLESENWRTIPPKLIVLTIQKEVAQRIIAKPPHMNLLALSVQFYAKPEIIANISRNNFRPVPKVDSAIIRLTPGLQTSNPGQTEKTLKIIKIGFSEKRKQLASVLSKKLKLNKDTILEAFQKTYLRPDIRPESLTLEQWIELEKHLNT